jgi:integrase
MSRKQNKHTSPLLSVKELTEKARLYAKSAKAPSTLLAYRSDWFHFENWYRLHRLQPLAKRNKLDNVGWHTFRHTYRSWLGDTGAPMGVQQKLMRHADISTTAKYGDALMESKRKHNSIVVRRALGNE